VSFVNCKQPTCEFCKDRPWEYRWNNNEKVLCCCSEPTREADFCPEGGYNRSGDECKFQCGHEECEAEMKAKYGAESDEDTTNCGVCEVKIGYNEAIYWENMKYCEECYEVQMIRDIQNYTPDETDCISCGFAISPNDVLVELVDGLCPDCKADGSFQAEMKAKYGAESEDDYMVSSDSHRLDEGSTNIQKIVSSNSSIDYPEWWKSKFIFRHI